MNHRHFILNKPFGYLCQFVCDLEKKKLIKELYDFPEGTMAIGRLDEESEGLLLLTTDGHMSEHVRGKKIEKEYYAQVDGLIDPDSLLKLQTGVEIGIRDVKYQTKPCKAFVLETDPGFPPRTKKIRDDRHGPTCWVSITLTEGKYRQIRKMTAAVGFPTLRLVRVRIGKIKLYDLKPGEGGAVAATLNLYFSLTSYSGTWSENEMESWMKDAGLKIMKPVVPMSIPGFKMIVGKK